MNLAIIGATGGTGLELTKQALALGHTVRVLVRSPEKVKTTHERLEVVKADLMHESAEKLAEKLGPSEVVLSALGAGTQLGITRLYSEGTDRIIAAMSQAKLKRLIVVSSVGTDPTTDEPWWYLWLVRRLLINVYVDLARMEQNVMATDLDWIIVRPSQFTNGEKTGTYRVTPRHLPEKGIRISRADTADFMLKQLEQTTFVRQTPTLSY